MLLLLSDVGKSRMPHQKWNQFILVALIDAPIYRVPCLLHAYTTPYITGFINVGRGDFYFVHIYTSLGSTFTSFKAILG